MTGNTRHRVTVDLGERSYDILVGAGLLGDAGEALVERYGRTRAVLVSDTNVAATHMDVVLASLTAAGISAATFLVEPGERSKSEASLQKLTDHLLENKLERGELVIALGGGVVGDLAGFASAIVRRGTEFAQLPTSLLAQVDSSVGGKTGINTRFGKNLLGAFHQPGLVLADTAALDTLPERHLKAGYAEVVKYGLIDDAEFFNWLEGNWRAILTGGPERDEAVARSCAAKARIVAEDERETGRRALLNLGHTFGHALEAATGYGETLIHGEAVAVGMAMAFRYSVRAGYAGRQDCQRVEMHLQQLGLPIRLGQIPGGGFSVDRLMTHISQDKKVKQGRLTFILTRGIGQAFIADTVAAPEIAAFLSDELTT